MPGPVVVRPLHGVDVLGIHAEVEDVFLRDAQVLEQLPHAVLESIRARPALVRRHVFERIVQADVRLLPVENPGELFSERFVTHRGLWIPEGGRDPRPIGRHGGLPQPL